MIIISKNFDSEVLIFLHLHCARAWAWAVENSSPRELAVFASGIVVLPAK